MFAEAPVAPPPIRISGDFELNISLIALSKSESFIGNFFFLCKFFVIFGEYFASRTFLGRATITGPLPSEFATSNASLTTCLISSFEVTVNPFLEQVLVIDKISTFWKILPLLLLAGTSPARITNGVESA